MGLRSVPGRSRQDGVEIPRLAQELELDLLARQASLLRSRGTGIILDPIPTAGN